MRDDVQKMLKEYIKGFTEIDWIKTKKNIKAKLQNLTTIESLSNALNLSKDPIYRRLDTKANDKFNIEELWFLSKVLNCTIEDLIVTKMDNYNEPFCDFKFSSEDASCENSEDIIDIALYNTYKMQSYRIKNLQDFFIFFPFFDYTDIKELYSDPNFFADKELLLKRVNFLYEKAKYVHKDADALEYANKYCFELSKKGEINNGDIIKGSSNYFAFVKCFYNDDFSAYDSVLKEQLEFEEIEKSLNDFVEDPSKENDEKLIEQFHKLFDGIF